MVSAARSAYCSGLDLSMIAAAAVVLAAAAVVAIWLPSTRPAPPDAGQAQRGAESRASAGFPGTTAAR
jgi:hypothetical protein